MSLPSLYSIAKDNSCLLLYTVFIILMQIRNVKNATFRKKNLSYRILKKNLKGHIFPLNAETESGKIRKKLRVVLLFLKD